MLGGLEDTFARAAYLSVEVGQFGREMDAGVCMTWGGVVSFGVSGIMYLLARHEGKKAKGLEAARPVESVTGEATGGSVYRAEKEFTEEVGDNGWNSSTP